jgi:hypothetical protein
MDGAVNFTHLLFFFNTEYRLLIGITQNINEQNNVSAKITVCLSDTDTFSSSAPAFTTSCQRSQASPDGSRRTTLTPSHSGTATVL